MVDIEDMFTQIVSKLDALMSQRAEPPREYVSVKEFADTVGLRADTVRDHLRQGRIEGEHRACGRGGRQEWKISTAEVKRYLEDGLRPPVRSTGSQSRSA